MQRPDKTPHSIRFPAVLGALTLLAIAAPALAQDGSAHPLDSALEMMNLKTKAGPMPDFVTQSRGAQAEDSYIPIGAKPPSRGLKPKTAAEVKALTADLDAARTAQVAGKRPKPMGAAVAPKTPSKTGGKPLALKTGAAPATNR